MNDKKHASVFVADRDQLTQDLAICVTLLGRTKFSDVAKRLSDLSGLLWSADAPGGEPTPGQFLYDLVDAENATLARPTWKYLTPAERLMWERIASNFTAAMQPHWDEPSEREAFEEAAYAHYLKVRQRPGGVAFDDPVPRERTMLFGRNEKGEYIAVVYQAAWGGWKLARGGV